MTLDWTAQAARTGTSFPNNEAKDPELIQVQVPTLDPSDPDYLDKLTAYYNEFVQAASGVLTPGVFYDYYNNGDRSSGKFIPANEAWSNAGQAVMSLSDLNVPLAYVEQFMTRMATANGQRFILSQEFKQFMANSLYLQAFLQANAPLAYQMIENIAMLPSVVWAGLRPSEMLAAMSGFRHDRALGRADLDQDSPAGKANAPILAMQRLGYLPKETDYPLLRYGQDLNALILPWLDPSGRYKTEANQESGKYHQIVLPAFAVRRTATGFQIGVYPSELNVEIFFWSENGQKILVPNQKSHHRFDQNTPIYLIDKQVTYKGRNYRIADQQLVLSVYYYSPAGYNSAIFPNLSMAPVTVAEYSDITGFTSSQAVSDLAASRRAELLAGQ